MADQVRIAGLGSFGHIPLDPDIGIVHRIGFRQVVIVIILVHHPTNAELTQVREATGALRLGLGLRQRGQQQRRQDGNNGDDSQQLEECEAPTP